MLLFILQITNGARKIRFFNRLVKHDPEIDLCIANFNYGSIAGSTLQKK